MKKSEIKKITIEEWLKEGKELFGPDKRDWKFICPNCGHIQSGRDFMELNRLKISDVEASTVVFFSCIGRFDTRIPEEKIGTIYDNEPKKQPCNYTNGGLFCLAKLIVINPDGKETSVFEFARESNVKVS